LDAIKVGINIIVIPINGAPRERTVLHIYRNNPSGLLVHEQQKNHGQLPLIGYRDSLADCRVEQTSVVLVSLTALRVINFLFR
jgi:hypothetical protein